MVKRFIVFLLLSIISVASLNAQSERKHTLAADVMAQGLMGYNGTYRWYGGIDLKGNLRVDQTNFALNFEGLTANVYSVSLTATPEFEICKNGILFLDGTLHSRIFAKYKTYEFVYAASVGFKMRHFSAQVGVFSRTIDALGRSWHSLDNYIAEPFNFLYRIKVSIMGFDHPWDVVLTFSDYNDFEYERMWEPIFSLGGRWDFKDRWSAVAEGTLEPAGMFHGTVKFYEATLRLGVKYKL